MSRRVTVTKSPEPMDEVILLEGQIRDALKGKQKCSDDLLSDAKAIMSGKPTKLTGTRLERLQKIAAGFSAK